MQGWASSSRPFNAPAITIYGWAVAVGLTLYGLLGTMVAPFRESVWHGVACLALPGIYPIYFHATHPEGGWKPFINMILGFGLIWAAVQIFPVFRTVDAQPARRQFARGEGLEGIGPSRSDPDPPGAGRLTATTGALAKLLAGVTDETSARRAAPRYRQPHLLKRARGFDAAGEPRALDARDELVSISAVIKLGPRFRDANREFEAQRKRIRRTACLSEILRKQRR